jgi:hypothetical protein
MLLYIGLRSFIKILKVRDVFVYILILFSE